MPSLEIFDLTVSIMKKTICRALTFSAQTGDIIGVLGPNGSGKTTFLHTLIGLHKPLAGQISVSNKPIHHIPPKALAKAMGILFQDTQFKFPQSVYDFCLGSRYPHLDAFSRENTIDHEIAQHSLLSMKLENLSQQSVLTLSGGERKRLSIAALLTQKPSIYLLDEPTNHLDLHHQVNVLQHFTEVCNNQSSLAIIALHDINHAQRYCNKILLLFPDGTHCFGNVDEILTPDNLSTLYSHPIYSVMIEGAKIWLTRS